VWAYASGKVVWLHVAVQHTVDCSTHATRCGQVPEGTGLLPRTGERVRVRVRARLCVCVCVCIWRLERTRGGEGCADARRVTAAQPGRRAFITRVRAGVRWCFGGIYVSAEQIGWQRESQVKSV
jgi:hypothetical protein